MLRFQNKGSYSTNMYSHLMWTPHERFQQIKIIHLSTFPTKTQEELLENGFSFSRSYSKFTSEESKLMWTALTEIANGDIEIPVKGKYYYLSHHVLHRSKDEDEVKAWMKKIETKHELRT